jgi:hypothetical protein
MKTEESISQLTKRKNAARAFLMSLSPDNKIAKLVALQEQYYSTLELREANGGKAIPPKWRKWFAARRG